MTALEVMAIQIGKTVMNYHCEGALSFPTANIPARFELNFWSNGLLNADFEIIQRLEAPNVGANLNAIEFGPLFSCSGTTTEENITVQVNNCILTSRTISPRVSRGSFVFQEAIFSPAELQNRPCRRIMISVDLIGAEETLHVDFAARGCTLKLAHPSEMKEIVSQMRATCSPLISATLEIYPGALPSATFAEIIDSKIEIAEDFLKMLRLSQTCWSDWCRITILQQVEGGGHVMRPVVSKWSMPKIRPHNSRGIVSIPYSQTFLKLVFSNYDRRLQQQYGFDFALERYIESNGSVLLESRYISATTAMELLVGRYFGEESRRILPRGRYRELKNVLEPSIRSWSIQNNIPSEDENLIIGKLPDLNRTSYRNSIIKMLEDLQIRYDDLGVTIKQIVDGRNDIIHRGLQATQSPGPPMSRLYDALMVLLTRVFLALLHYEGSYDDWIRGWISFQSVLNNSTKVEH